MTAASGVTVTGEIACITVDSELQSFGMDVFSDGLHSGREFCRIRMYKTLLIPLAMPSVINVDIYITHICQTKVNQSIDGLFYDVFINVSHELIP